ncbi:MAG: universal stress protein, partial [Actinomycetota bacterium]|nr:universal stress protein [Actinomycetota bacterium]
HLVRRINIFPTKILVATDGSRAASLAEDAAVELSNGTGSELHVVHVLRTTPELPYPRSLAKERSEALVEWRKLSGLKLLDDRVRRIEDLGGSVAASHYKEGDPEKEVIRLGEELDAGLIVMGGQRRPWFERIFGAGFSENVLRRAKRPVLVVGGRGLRGSTVPR